MGVIFYVLLTRGNFPFTEVDIYGGEIFNDDGSALRKRINGIDAPANAKALLSRMLELDETKRPTLKELQSDPFFHDHMPLKLTRRVGSTFGRATKADRRILMPSSYLKRSTGVATRFPTSYMSEAAASIGSRSPSPKKQRYSVPASGVERNPEYNKIVSSVSSQDLSPTKRQSVVSPSTSAVNQDQDLPVFTRNLRRNAISVNTSSEELDSLQLPHGSTIILFADSHPALQQAHLAPRRSGATLQCCDTSTSVVSRCTEDGIPGSQIHKAVTRRNSLFLHRIPVSSLQDEAEKVPLEPISVSLSLASESSSSSPTSSDTDDSHESVGSPVNREGGPEKHHYLGT